VTTFTVWKFADAGGAARATSVLQEAEGEGLVKIVDHAVVSWPPGAEKPDVDHGHDSKKRAMGWGALWGIMGGALFAIPIVGGVVGVGIAALSKATQDTGIRKEDLERIRVEVVEGTSALFVVTDEGDVERLAERLQGFDKVLVHTNLTDAERAALLESFGGG
jgi:uncharacterized membrane protein